MYGGQTTLSWARIGSSTVVLQRICLSFPDIKREILFFTPHATKSSPPSSRLTHRFQSSVLLPCRHKHASPTCLRRALPFIHKKRGSSAAEDWAHCPCGGSVFLESVTSISSCPGPVHHKDRPEAGGSNWLCVGLRGKGRKWKLFSLHLL